MKVLFLDIDGVLNCAATHNPRKLPYVVDPKLLDRCIHLLRQTGAEVVLSSTWRYDPAGLFSAKRWGIPFIDVTPDMPHSPRRDEILAWVAGHPEVERYAVIDDEDDELDQLPLFQPFSSTGLTQDICDGVAAYLAGLTDRDMRRGRTERFLQNLKARLKGHKD